MGSISLNTNIKINSCSFCGEELSNEKLMLELQGEFMFKSIDPRSASVDNKTVQSTGMTYMASDMYEGTHCLIFKRLL